MKMPKYDFLRFSKWRDENFPQTVFNRAHSNGAVFILMYGNFQAVSSCNLEFLKICLCNKLLRVI